MADTGMVIPEQSLSPITVNSQQLLIVIKGSINDIDA